MLSLLSAIGFACDPKRKLAELLAELVQKKTERIAGEAGITRVWRSPTGAELLLRYRNAPLTRTADERVHALTDLVGLTPFHQGLGAIAATPLAEAGRDDDDPMGGSWRVALDPDRHTGRTPDIVVEMAPFEPLGEGRSHGRRNLQVVGFCHAFDVYADLHAYFSGLQAQYLVAPGTICAAPYHCADGGSVHRNPVLITGRVRNRIRHTNPLTGIHYLWALIATERGLVDCVAAMGGMPLPVMA